MYHFFTKHKMCNLIQILCVLLAVGFTSSWDIAVLDDKEILLLTKNGTLEKITGQYRDLRSLYYDSVRDILFFANSSSIFAVQFGCERTIDVLVESQPTDSIRQLVFEPVTNTLFWTNGTGDAGQINRMQLDNGLDDPKIDVILTNVILGGIAVDSCNGYIYWNNADHRNASIERSKLDNFKRETVVNSGLYMPMSIVVDQSSSKLFWINHNGASAYHVQTADLDGGNRRNVYNGTRGLEQYALAVDEENVYWIDFIPHKVVKYPKNSSATEPSFFNELGEDIIKDPKNIVTKVDILKQIQGKEQCRNFERFIEKSVSKFDGKQRFCLRNVTKLDSSVVTDTKCPQLSSGQLYDICHNYCIHGTCQIVKGTPNCSCADGFGGSRCELSCQNDTCCVPSAGASDSQCQRALPVPLPAQKCLCPENTIIPRDVNNEDNIVMKSTTEKSEEDTIKPTSIKAKDDQNTPRNSVDEFDKNDKTESASQESCFCLGDQLSNPLIMALLALCGCLSLMCAVLAAKLLQLKKRPRIKKRYIVNKNVTPLTCRPEAGQCEITIENCCNMNICETPCFEPQGLRSTSVPSGKEEKRNLIANMEHPDDLY